MLTTTLSAFSFNIQGRRVTHWDPAVHKIHSFHHGLRKISFMESHLTMLQSGISSLSDQTLIHQTDRKSEEMSSNALKCVTLKQVLCCCHTFLT